jgi:Protein of unknown function (DUF3103)
MKQLAFLVSLSLAATACLGEETSVNPPVDDTKRLQEMKRDVAYEVAGLLNDPGFRVVLTQQFDAGQDSVQLVSALAAQAEGALGTEQSSDAARRLALLDYQIRASKGIEAYASSLLEVRLIRPASGAAAIDWATIPVAYLPSGDEDEWTEVQAFDASGNTIVLDPEVQPDVPVLVAGIDAREDLRAGIEYINAELARRGLRTPADLVSAAASTETSKLDYIRLNDDKEPWLSGAAELYALVSGVDFDASRVQIEAVDLPYLDHDGTNYSPNQILVFWENYRFAAANVQLYEHDDNTNYQSLVLALVSAVEAVLDFTAPQYALIARIANEIIAAMPSGWFANDDDYVDSFYTLEKGRAYTSHNGAAGNARINLTPYTLQSN